MDEKSIYHIMYKTPLGFMFTDIEAESRDDALLELWAEHNRDTCEVMWVATLHRRAEGDGDESADEERDGQLHDVPKPFFLDMGETRNCGSPYTAIAIVAFTILGFLLGFILARMT